MSIFTPKIPDSLRGSTLCLTGFSGYVGSHLLRTLVAAGVRPFLIPRQSSDGVQVYGADCATAWSHPGELAEQLAGLENPIIINLAGHFISTHQPVDVQPLVAGNLDFPIMIFDALVSSGHNRIVNVGTTWEYSDAGVPSPRNLYAQLKSANAQVLEWYAARNPLRAINLKLNDTYGGDDTRSKLLPLLKKNWLAKSTMQLRSWAQPINLLHITDVQEGLLAAAARTMEIEPHTAETALLIDNETTKLGEIVDRLRNGIAPGIGAEFSDTSTENPSLAGVWSTGPQLTNWSPRISLGAGLNDYFKVDV